MNAHTSHFGNTSISVLSRQFDVVVRVLDNEWGDLGSSHFSAMKLTG